MLNERKSEFVVLAIDPGYDRLGLAVIKETNGTLSLVFSDCIFTKKKDTHNMRLAVIGEAVADLIRTSRPNAIAIEELFFSKNVKTALLVSQAIGVIVYEAAKKSIPLFYYKPAQIKIAVTGHGASDKKQVTNMVLRLIKVNKKITHDDEFDAIAVGITHLACRHDPRHKT